MQKKNRGGLIIANDKKDGLPINKFVYIAPLIYNWHMNLAQNIVGAAVHCLLKSIHFGIYSRLSYIAQLLTPQHHVIFINFSNSLYT